MAFTEYSGGKREVYITSFPGKTGKWQVSVSGGSFPWWRADGKELFFQGSDQSVFAAPIHAGDTFQAGVPLVLFRVPLVTGQYTLRTWTPTTDGQRFYVVTPSQGAQVPRITVVTNWAAELAKR